MSNLSRPDDAFIELIKRSGSPEKAEALGEDGRAFRQMGFSIEKVTVTAKSRALKAEYSLELAQDLKAIH